MMTPEGRFNELVAYLSGFDGVVVAFSGGVDSSVLAAAAHHALGDRALAVTADFVSVVPGEIEGARRIAEEIGIEHLVAEFNVLDMPGFAENPPDRCYHCKKGLINLLQEIAKEREVDVILDGTNASDLWGHRPGFRAMKELGVIAPYVDREMTKTEIREVASHLCISVMSKPSLSCLATRIPYGQHITPDRLSRIGEAEKYLCGMGFKQVRVRDHDGLARIEIDKPWEMLEKDLSAINARLKSLGFQWVALDLDGYRSGSLDESLKG